jgi:transketolase
MPSSRELANAIRFLSIDAVQKAKSGHPGAPMGMADIAEVLWRKHLKHNPNNPKWHNRDRFVLSNGHGSMLLYSLLHLTGYNLDIDQIKNFRQMHSATAGHPEFGYAPGIETTTGPLGQGIANAVGMAIAEKTLAAQFNKPEFSIVDHFTYVFLGDGCLMEGISHEVCSLAGTLKLGKLIAIYDDNGISIDGDVQGWFSDDTANRFKAYGWHVIDKVDGHNPEAIDSAIAEARNNQSQPTLICCKTTIGFGSPNKSGTANVHGAPLGDAEVKLTREALNWQHDSFVIPEEIYKSWDAKEAGESLEHNWNALFASYESKYPELATEFLRRSYASLPDDFNLLADKYINQCQQNKENIATRKASQNTLNAFGPILPELLGGSADLAGSNLTLWEGSKGITGDNPEGNYIFYGVREFGMSAIMNGITLHGGFIPYGATFLVFMEYACNAVRMAALMKQRSIFVYTHDSIGLGEDGPTHQPVEQIASLRLTPNLDTWRPCDTVESAVAWKAALIKETGPSALLFSRQGLVCQDRTPEQVKLIERGGYILSDCSGTPDLILIATGSEVELAMQAKLELEQRNYQIRVVSMPSTEIFDQQDAEYKNSVLPINITNRIAIEAAAKDFWYKYVGIDGRIIGMSSFGESAPAKELFEFFGFTVNNVVDTAAELLSS